MGSTADYIIILVLLVVGIGHWSAHDRLAKIECELAAIKAKLGV